MNLLWANTSTSFNNGTEEKKFSAMDETGTEHYCVFTRDGRVWASEEIDDPVAFKDLVESFMKKPYRCMDEPQHVFPFWDVTVPPVPLPLFAPSMPCPVLGGGNDFMFGAGSREDPQCALKPNPELHPTQPS